MRSEEIGFKEITFKKLLKDVFYFLFGLFLIFVFLSLFNFLFVKTGILPDDSNNVRKIINKLSFGEIVLAIYLSGIVEEIFFRGFLQNKIGILPSSIIFTYLHMGYGSIIELVSVFIISLILGYIYIKNDKRIYSNILIHCSFNAISFLSNI